MQASLLPHALKLSTRIRRALAQRGFTAIEILVVVGIMGILAALAGPSFTSLIERWRVRQAVEEMTSTIYYARSEAIKRGGRIGVQKIANNTGGCTLASTNSDWGCGWFVFDDKSANGKWVSGESILQTFTIPPNVNVMHKSGGISFNVDRWGKIGGLNAKGFIFTPEFGNISSPATRGICLSSGGRLRVIEDVPCS